MNLPFSFFLALRYLKPKRSFLSVISLITLAGVTIGIMVLVVVIAVMSGFRREMQKKILGHDPHLFIEQRGGLVDDEEGLRKKLATIPGVEATAPYVMAPVLIEAQGEVNQAMMRGIYPEAEDKLLGVRQYVKEGAYDLDGDKCLLGTKLAAGLKVHLGDKILIHGPRNLQSVAEELKKAEQNDPNAKKLSDIRELLQPSEVEVTGLFETGEFTYDSQIVLVPLHIAQEVYGLEWRVHGVAVRVPNPFAVLQDKERIAQALGPDFVVESWIDRNRTFFNAVEFERTMMYFIVSLVVVVAAFSITNTLLTITFQKRRDIGMLKALGASPGGIVRVFICQGVVVGLVGNLLGFGAAGLVLAFRNEIKNFLQVLTGHEIFPAEIYHFNSLPAEVIPTDMLIIGTIAFGFCVLAAVIPAWFAARLDPVRALREE